MVSLRVGKAVPSNDGTSTEYCPTIGILDFSADGTAEFVVELDSGANKLYNEFNTPGLITIFKKASET